MDLIQIANLVGTLSEKITGLDKHFTNHLHNHFIDRVFVAVQTLVIIGLFCFLKWGS